MPQPIERAPSHSAQAAINSLIQLYFDGLYFGDIERLADVFHPEAKYVCATESPYENLDIPRYFQRVENRPAPADSNSPRRDEILQMDFAGPHTAFVKVHCQIHDKFFTDYLSLICIDGNWSIIAKVFHYELGPVDTNSITPA